MVQESHERFVGDHEQLLLQPVPKAWNRHSMAQHGTAWHSMAQHGMDGTYGTSARQTAWLMGPLEALVE